MILELLLISNATSVCVEKFILIFLLFFSLPYIMLLLIMNLMLSRPFVKSGLRRPSTYAGQSTCYYGDFLFMMGADFPGPF